MMRAIHNFDVLATTELRRTALEIAEAGYAAINTGNALHRAISIEGMTLKVGERTYPLEGKNVYVIGVGKCSAIGAVALEEILGDHLKGGIVLDVAIPDQCPILTKIQCLTGTHPLPSEKNAEATAQIIGLLKERDENDIVIALISGGGSTLLCLPTDNMVCEDEAEAFKELSNRGASIQELNTVRKHISSARGGWLVEHARRATLVGLIISDVPDNDLSIIASGPTVFDTSTVADARAVLDRYEVQALAHVQLLETPKDHTLFDRVYNYLIETNRDALEAMRKAAEEHGLTAEIVTDDLIGEARTIGQHLAADLKEVPEGSAWFFGGETTVTITGAHGVGGRNQELALAALETIADDEIIIAFGSDGRDNSAAAGAICDTITRAHAKERGLNPADFLARHDSFPFFQQTGDAIMTGYTGSNVSDLIITIKNHKRVETPPSAPLKIEQPMAKNIVWMEDIGMDDVPMVGGKNASLGEMIRAVGPKGVKVPSGFVVTTDAYNYFMEKTEMDVFVKDMIGKLDVKNLKELAKSGKIIRNAITRARMPADLAKEITEGYLKMEERYGKNVDVAVRSSATAEDLPGASFAGEHETYLGIRGAKDVITATQMAFASLFTDRAISYRTDKGFADKKIALSVGVQKMARSDKACSGVMFTVDTETGLKNVVVINATWGLGELIVQGHVTPDEYQVFKGGIGSAAKPIIYKHLGVKMKKMIYDTSKGAKGTKRTKVIATNKVEQSTFILTDEEVMTLATWGKIIEDHYSERAGKWTPMDMEWAKDGTTGELYIVQARPETVQAMRDYMKMKEYTLHEHGAEVIRGISVGSSIATGKAHLVMDPSKISEFKQGEILVTTMTDPDWEPIMRMASAIITDKGGRTSHAAIVSRELGVPAIVGSGNATKKIKTGMDLSVSTIGADGIAYAGIAKFEVIEHDIAALPTPKTHIYVNVGSPGIASEVSFLPAMGVGLAREEFIIASQIAVHPLALINFKTLKAPLKKEIEKKMVGWTDPVQFYVDKLAFGIAQIGAAFHPRPVIVRFSDFKSNEYATLLGGKEFEPDEENPMIGWRGSSRYYDPKFAAAFELECKAICKVREEMGVDNIIPMIPIVRTVDEGRKVLEIMAKNGLVAKSIAKEGDKTLPVYMMCEIPSNPLLADQFLDLFDGMSIGSNDLTQMTLGLDRDGGIIAHIGNEKNEAVKKLVAMAIEACKRRGKYIGICGQGPSDYPEFAEFLVEQGIESISLNPDVIVKSIINIAEVEKRLGR